MSFMPRQFAPLLIGSFAAASILMAPTAFADPPSIPEPGEESAAATVRDLDALGYDVQLQFENGAPTVPLSQCQVTDIDTVGSAGTEKLAYVTITCAR
jgi:hypothetical protein